MSVLTGTILESLQCQVNDPKLSDEERKRLQHLLDRGEYLVFKREQAIIRRRELNKLKKEAKDKGSELKGDTKK